AFKAACGVSDEDLSTWEGITALGKKYYEWTDSLTPQKNDGKAFFGRDSMANYLLVGSMQLDKEIFSVVDGQVTFNLSKEAMSKMWENFYIPYINGYFGAYGRFRSDDVKTGQIIACVGSTSSASYFPTAVTLEDGTTSDIECQVMPLPNFKGTQPMAVQQGAGMVVGKSSKEKEYACVQFLKWFTDTKQNVEFSIMSGYLPVKQAANTPEALAAANEKLGGVLNDVTKKTLSVSMDMTKSYSLYTSPVFKDGYSARKVLEFSCTDLANENLVKIEELVKSGVSRDDAIAQFSTNEVFLQWLSQVDASFAKLQ
ncbi:MAG: extracellular solute-binding protein, partial [Oscillospiraceae bacterium]